MSTLQVTFNGRIFSFAQGTIVRIGRSSENDIVVNEPTVSRRHAQLSFEASGWVWQNSGQAPTFVAGQPVAQFAVGQQVDVCLASPQGPSLQLATAASHGQGAPGAGGTELAGAGTAGAVGQTNVAGQSPGAGTGQAADYAGAGAAAGAAAYASPGHGAQQQNFAGAVPAQGYPDQGGATPPGMPGFHDY